MVYHTQNYWVFGIFSSSIILGDRKHEIRNRQHSASTAFPVNLAEATLAKQADL
jgi:hypothetical protein